MNALVQWEPVDAEPPLYGPPKPASCVHGWTSHEYVLCIQQGAIGLALDPSICRLCSDGIADLEAHNLSGDLPATITFHIERYGWLGTEVDVWWELAPPPHIPGD